MINFRQAVRSELRRDGALAEILGSDADNEIKVYTFPLKPNVSRPYVTVSLIPVPGVEGVYGDDEVMERFLVQLSVWGESEPDAWAVATVAHDAMKTIHPEVTPWQHNFTQRYQNVESLKDEDSNLWQVVMRYEMRMGR